MREFYRALESILNVIRLLRGRVRARMLALRGAKVGRKVSLAGMCKIERPWCVRVGERSQIEESVYLKVVADDATLEVGSYVFIGRGSEVDVQCSVLIGDHALIAPGCFITDHGHGMSADLRIDEQATLPKQVRIGKDAWLGANVTVLAGVTIGDGAVIGSNAVVTRDVPPMAVAAGIPARVLRYRGSVPTPLRTTRD